MLFEHDLLHMLRHRRTSRFHRSRIMPRRLIEI